MSTAAVVTLPGTRQITVPVLSRDQRAGELRDLAWLAAMPDSCPSSHVIAIVIAALASETLRGAALEDAWKAYLESVRLHREVDDQVVPWTEVAGDDHESAVRICGQVAEGALKDLLDGLPASRQEPRHA